MEPHQLYATVVMPLRSVQALNGYARCAQPATSCWWLHHHLQLRISGCCCWLQKLCAVLVAKVQHATMSNAVPTLCCGCCGDHALIPRFVVAGCQHCINHSSTLGTASLTGTCFTLANASTSCAQCSVSHSACNICRIRRSACHAADLSTIALEVLVQPARNLPQLCRAHKGEVCRLQQATNRVSRLVWCWFAHNVCCSASSREKGRPLCSCRVSAGCV